MRIEMTKILENRIRNCLDAMSFLNDNVNDVFYIYDISANRIHFTNRVDKHFNLLPMHNGTYTFEELGSFLYPRDMKELRASVNKLLDGSSNGFQLECWFVNRDGKRIWIRIGGKLQKVFEHDYQWIVGRITNKPDEKSVDSLTGLFNSKKLTEDLNACLKKKARGFFMVLGIDNFRNINARYGRGHGNQVLKQVAEILDGIVGNQGRLYRLDSDKFAVNIVDGNKQNVNKLYEQIQKRSVKHCTISSGVTEYAHYMRSDTIFQYAESALEQAKQLGKNIQVFFTSDIYEKQMSQIALQEELKTSVSNGCEGFYLCYQPQIDGKTYEIFGAEALLRFKSPIRGIVGPNEFIPVLEQTDLIYDVGEWVLKTAIMQCKKWRKYRPDFHISVNVSHVQFQDNEMVEFVLKTLEEADLPGEALTLEMTESIQLQDFQHYNKIFYKLERHGIQIAIDDFGSGYSNLSYLKNLAVDEIKIVRDFVSRIQHSAYNYRLLSNMIELAHSADIRVCCEGVETEEELLTIRELHPDLYQGFLFSKLYSEEQLERKYFKNTNEDYIKCRQQAAYYRSLAYSVETEGKELVEQEKLSIIVDSMEELVYVRDTYSYDLLYLNDAGREITGVYDYRGRKCYEVLQGRTAPCEFCPKNYLSNNEYHVWEMASDHLKKNFLLKEKQIPWMGKTANLTIAIDITEKEIMSQKIQEKLDFESNIVSCTKMLVEESDFHKAINSMLGSIGEFYQADRAYLFELQNNKEYWDNTYEWCADGVMAQIDMLQNVPMSTVKRWMELFRKGDSIVIDDIDKIKEESPEEWEILNIQNIKRLIVSPIWNNGNVIGFIGVDDPKKHIHDCGQVQTMAVFVADRIQKDEAKDRLSELLNFQYKDILKTTNLGLWVMRISKDRKTCQMFVDQTMKEIMGMKADISPEECYQYWHGHIDEGYFEYVKYAVESMIQTGRIVELAYTWNHPVKGEVSIRCLGVRVQDNHGMICLEGYHREINEVDRPHILPEEKTIIFEYNERKKTIYFHNDRRMLAGSEEREENFPACWIDSDMVHPHFVNKFEAIFENVHENEEIEGEEILLKTQEANYEWFKLKTRRLGTDEQNSSTMVVMLDPANQERAMELEYMRQQDFYKAILSETIAYAEIDMESQQMLRAGGLWLPYMNDTFREKKYIDILTQYKDLLIHPEDVEAYEQFLNIATMRDLMWNKKDTSKLEFRRLINGEMRWVELTGHVFQEQFSENIYALIYMKDIDAEKKREMANELAATRDPLTKVFNRKAFEEEVVKHVMSTNDNNAGTLILLDMDNFKEINDTYGHGEGDRVLNQLVDTLMQTFRRKDIIGRLGGDEFMIFLKSVTNKDVINRRMDELRSALLEMNRYMTTCSAGITFVSREEFSYDECLHQADIALYRSKENGKNTYCYYEG